MGFGLIILALILIVGIFLWTTYNSLVVAKQRVAESWSGIDVQLKRRNDLIPNLVETVKGYATHEREVFENVTKARTALMDAGNAKQAAEANNMLTDALKSLFAVAEAYPDLKASENFKHLQQELSDTETKIAASRQFYNANVLDLNTKIKVFPTVLIAGPLGFTSAEFFETAEEEKKPVEVKF